MMSKRPTEHKQRRRVAKALRRQKLPAYFDLVQWLVDRNYANTKRAAKQLILAHRVRANSHVLGVIELGGEEVVTRYVPAELKRDVIVLENA